MWELTMSYNAFGSTSNQLGYYYTSVTAHIVNHASDGNTHDLLAGALHLYPVVNGITNFNISELLAFPNPYTDYTIYHNTSHDISLTFLVPCAITRFTLYLAHSDFDWTYSVTPPSYCL